MIKKTLFLLSFTVLIFLGFQLITHYKSKEKYASNFVEPQWGDSNNPVTSILSLSESFKNKKINKEKYTRRFAKPQTRDFISSNNDFALKMFEHLRTKNTTDENVIFSPYSLNTAFGMLYAGSKGNTAEEIESVFGFTDASHKELQNTASYMENLSGVTLTSANSFWIQKGFPILESYKKHMSTYDAEILHADFRHQPKQSKKRINTWVKHKTNGLIQDLVKRIHPDTRTILINALYFKGDWDKPFKKKLTRSDVFKSPNGNRKIDMMNQKDDFRYTHVENKFQILDMPYKGDNVSMMILLPEENFNFSLEELNSWHSNLDTQKVDIYFPKFEIDTSYALKEDFESLGIVDAFDIDKADFSGVSEEKLFLSKIIHKAIVKVNETGTEAAAVSATFLRAGSAMDKNKPIVFRADRPFVFLIYEKHTKTILFIGLVNKP